MLSCLPNNAIKTVNYKNDENITEISNNNDPQIVFEELGIDSGEVNIFVEDKRAKLLIEKIIPYCNSSIKFNVANLGSRNEIIKNDIITSCRQEHYKDFYVLDAENMNDYGKFKEFKNQNRNSLISKLYNEENIKNYIEKLTCIFKENITVRKSKSSNTVNNKKSNQMEQEDQKELVKFFYDNVFVFPQKNGLGTPESITWPDNNDISFLGEISDGVNNKIKEIKSNSDIKLLYKEIAMYKFDVKNGNLNLPSLSDNIYIQFLTNWNRKFNNSNEHEEIKKIIRNIEATYKSKK